MTDLFDSLPKDPAMLMSYINTKLRDEYRSLEALCDDLHIDPDKLKETLAAGGFEYNEAKNRVW